MALGSKAAIEHDVAVEQRAGGVDQRIVFVVAFHQHGVEGGDGAGTEVPARSIRRASRVKTEGV